MFQGKEYVYEVYRERSFIKAAQNLFISQPSLSATVKRIEQQIGYPLFDRSTKPLGLTECGARYIRAVEQIMSVEHEFSNFVNDWGDLKTGSLILGGSSLFSSLVLPSLIGEFSRCFPLVKLTLVEESTARLEELLQQGSVNLVIDNHVPDPGLFEHAKFQEESLLLAVPESFAVNQRMGAYQLKLETIYDGSFLEDQIAAVPLEEFSQEPFIMLKPENDTRKRAVRLCQSRGFLPRTIFELDQQMTAYNITCSGMGISFVSSTLICRTPPNPGVVYYKLEGEISMRNIYFYWKKGRYLSRAMEEFLRIAASPAKSPDFLT